VSRPFRPLAPVKFGPFLHTLGSRPCTILDIGCGNNSPSMTKKYFPQCTYHGLDREDYNLDDSDRKAMDRLFRVDLDRDSLDGVPDDTYDLVIMSHVVEHLRRPVEIVSALCRKVRPGGFFYLEFPDIRSLGLPSMEGTLQFSDDPTHIHLPDPYVLANVLLGSGFDIRFGGVRRESIRYLMTPVFHARNLARRVSGRRPHSRGLWDASGFAFQLIGQKR
jgi:SAM-dependent methyltransferase